MRRKQPLKNGEIYHIFNKSIAGFKIFHHETDYQTMIDRIRYYQIEMSLKFSDFVDLEEVQNKGFDRFFASASKNKDKRVQILTYCIMPSHFHLVLKQLQDNGISIFVGNIQNSYTRYFNVKHNRKGPLWVGKFKNVWAETDEQLLHLTRYVHLNPVTAYIVDLPEQWAPSSYLEYIEERKNTYKICELEGVLKIHPLAYRQFVEDRISYQRDLEKIKKFIFS